LLKQEDYDLGSYKKKFKVAKSNQNSVRPNFDKNCFNSSDQESGENQCNVIVVEAQVYQANSALVNCKHQCNFNNIKAAIY